MKNLITASEQKYYFMSIFKHYKVPDAMYKKLNTLKLTVFMSCLFLVVLPYILVTDFLIALGSTHYSKNLIPFFNFVKIGMNVYSFVSR